MTPHGYRCELCGFTVRPGTFAEAQYREHIRAHEARERGQNTNRTALSVPDRVMLKTNRIVWDTEDDAA